MHYLIIMFLIILFLIFIYLLLIMPRFTHRKQTDQFKGLLYAHRGLFQTDAGIPENSMAAFSRAVRHGFPIELDVQITKDRQLVVFHDYTLGRMCGIDLPVESMTYEELSSCRLLDTKETIPLFKDVLDLVDGKTTLLIEIKLHSYQAYTCELVYKLLQEYNGTYCIESFNSLALFWFRKHAPEIVRGQLSSNLTKPIAEGGFFLSFFVKYLLTNIIGRPDFIAYSYRDTKNPSLRLNRWLFNTPVFAWTIRSQKLLDSRKKSYDALIFDSFVPYESCRHFPEF